MKQNEIVLGEDYFTKIGGALVRVKVLSIADPSKVWGKRVRYVVQRADNGKTLPKSRTASALRLTK